MDIGIEKAGGELLFANDTDKGAVATIRRNCPDIPVYNCSVQELSGQKILAEVGVARGDIDLLCGGPPCQSYSVYGNREGVLDPRGQLVFDFVRLVGEIQPKTFIMENVRGLHSMALVPLKSAKTFNGYEPWMSAHGSLLSDIVGNLREFGYQVDVFLVNSVNYGAPQIRERMLIIGNRLGVPNQLAEPTHSNRPYEDLPPFRTLRDVVGEGFSDYWPEIMNFSARKLHYLSMVPPGGNWRSLPVELQKESMGKSWYLKGGRSATWRRLSWDFPSPTVVTMPNHASTSMCHPEELRALTVGECAAIQEFPLDWEFLGTTSEKYRQIGNAVPTRLGQLAGEAIANILHSASHGLGRVKPQCRKSPVNVIHLRPHVRTKRYWHNGEALAGDHSYYDDTSLPLFA